MEPFSSISVGSCAWNPWDKKGVRVAGRFVSVTQRGGGGGFEGGEWRWRSKRVGKREEEPREVFNSDFWLLINRTKTVFSRFTAHFLLTRRSFRIVRFSFRRSR